MTDPKPPTWCDVATLARAVATLTGDADLTHDLLVGLAAPIVRSMAVMVAVLETDPHGDSDGDSDGGAPRHDGLTENLAGYAWRRLPNGQFEPLDVCESVLRQPLFRTRQAMHDAGLLGWEHGSGLSSAEAIRELARQRDDLARELAELRGDGQ